MSQDGPQNRSESAQVFSSMCFSYLCATILGRSHSHEECWPQDGAPRLALIWIIWASSWCHLGAILARKLRTNDALGLSWASPIAPSIGIDLEYLGIIMVPSWLHLAEDSKQVAEEASLKPRNYLHSEVQKLHKMSQDGPQNRSKIAHIANMQVFSSMCF